MRVENLTKKMLITEGLVSISAPRWKATLKIEPLIACLHLHQK